MNLDPQVSLSIMIFGAAYLLIYGCLYYLERKRYILLWFISWLFYTLSYFIYFINPIAPHYLIYNAIDNVIVVISYWAIAKGSVEFFTEKNYRWINYVSYLTIAYSIILGFTNLNAKYSIMPRMIFEGVLLIYTGVSSMRMKYVKSKTRHILGIFFVLWGFSTFAYILGYVIDPMIFYPAFTIMGATSTGATIAMLILYFQKSRENQVRMDQKMQYLIMYDSLTGVYNRGYCELEMGRLDIEEQLPISVILGDMNGLKLINDILGHNKGDLMLLNAANIMKSSAPGHLTGRWGGDEFIIVLAKTTPERALEIIQNIKDKCKEYRNDTFPLDLSLGTATKHTSRQKLSDVIEAADNMLYRNKFTQSRFIRRSITDYLTSMLLAKNIETEEHLLRMKEMAYLLARKMGLAPEECEYLALAAFMHDIGKISIPDHILNKPGKLTREEWDIMKEHSVMGYRIAMSSDEFVHISQIVLSHHERWDGKGYPQGLKEQEIPLAARILTVIDAYDAMTHTRVYKESIGKEDALKEIERCAGTQFDPDVSKLFVGIIRESYEPSAVNMSVVSVAQAAI